MLCILEAKPFFFRKKNLTICISNYNSVYIFGRIRVNSEKRPLASSRLSVIRLSVLLLVFCVSPLISAAPTGTIFVKFDICNFYEMMPEKNPNFIKICQKYQATDMTTWVCLNCWHHYETLCLSKTVQWKPILAFSWQHSTALHCWQLHAGQKQYKG